MSQVTVYTKPGCLPCKRVLAKLLDAGLKHKAIDITTDPKAYEYVTVQLGAKSVPVVVSGETVIRGYEPMKLKKLIERLGSEAADAKRSISDASALTLNEE